MIELCILFVSFALVSHGCIFGGSLLATHSWCLVLDNKQEHILYFHASWHILLSQPSNPHLQAQDNLLGTSSSQTTIVTAWCSGSCSCRVCVCLRLFLSIPISQRRNLSPNTFSPTAAPVADFVCAQQLLTFGHQIGSTAKVQLAALPLPAPSTSSQRRGHLEQHHSQNTTQQQTTPTRQQLYHGFGLTHNNLGYRKFRTLASSINRR